MTVEEPAPPAANPLDPPTEQVRRRMQSQKTTGTRIELQVRRGLHSRGYRYRVDRRLLPDHPFRGDIVWATRRLAVFLDGCFWHGCPVHGTAPKSNAEWWRTKLAGNRDRDRRTDAILERRGWTVIRFWEHENPDEIVESIIDRLKRRP
ncbi:very short patch repair endonuclease [Mycobacterium antarcticum]|uniref:very short patch repair endonuclease n=2 Tax=unclassified Mycolicibacterium TaxID=2636767 RepID=UPI0024E0E485|nr:very short patch repair endonuclease [Mycolicibacterium sp. TUM20984]